MHDLTDRAPVSYCATVPTGYNTGKLKQDGLIVYIVKKEPLYLGSCTKQTAFGNDIRTYDMERTVCDIIRDRNSLDAAVVSDTLKRYVRRPDKDLNRLIPYIWQRVTGANRCFVALEVRKSGSPAAARGFWSCSTAK